VKVLRIEAKRLKGKKKEERRRKKEEGRRRRRKKEEEEEEKKEEEEEERRRRKKEEEVAKAAVCHGVGARSPASECLASGYTRRAAADAFAPLIPSSIDTLHSR
jgi:hypothetical protein